MPEPLRPFLALVAAHLYPALCLVAVIDATGVPFPGRLLLVLGGALSTGVAAAAGALAGDHLVFGLGRLGGERVQALCCRWTLTPGRCLPKAREYVERVGPAAIVLGRFVFTVRLLAALLAGSGAMSYPRFALLDWLGSVGWAACLILLGRVLGTRAADLLARSGGMQLAVTAVALGLVAVPAIRLWRRAREAAAPIPVAR